MISALFLGVVIGQSSGAAKAPQGTSTPGVWPAIRTAVTTLCPGADQEREAAVAAKTEIRDWSIYVHHVMRCGDGEKAAEQALLYTEAAGQIEQSILPLNPKGSEAGDWRQLAQELITKALSDSRSNPDLVNVLLGLSEQLQ